MSTIPKASVAVVSQIATVDKGPLLQKIGTLNKQTRQAFCKGVMMSSNWMMCNALDLDCSPELNSRYTKMVLDFVIVSFGFSYIQQYSIANRKS